MLQAHLHTIHFKRILDFGEGQRYSWRKTLRGGSGLLAVPPNSKPKSWAGAIISHTPKLDQTPETRSFSQIILLLIDRFPLSWSILLYTMQMGLCVIDSQMRKPVYHLHSIGYHHLGLIVVTKVTPVRTLISD
jgi:hypothetical protein